MVRIKRSKFVQQVRRLHDELVGLPEAVRVNIVIAYSNRLMSGELEEEPEEPGTSEPPVEPPVEPPIEPPIEPPAEPPVEPPPPTGPPSPSRDFDRWFRERIRLDTPGFKQVSTDVGLQLPPGTIERVIYRGIKPNLPYVVRMSLDGPTTLRDFVAEGGSDTLKFVGGCLVTRFGLHGTWATSSKAHIDSSQGRPDSSIDKPARFRRGLVVARDPGMEGVAEPPFVNAFRGEGIALDLEDIYIKSGNLTSWSVLGGFASDKVNRMVRVVVDREIMRRPHPLSLFYRKGEGLRWSEFDDNWIREPDGSLTKIPMPGSIA